MYADHDLDALSQLKGNAQNDKGQAKQAANS